MKIYTKMKVEKKKSSESQINNLLVELSKFFLYFQNTVRREELSLFPETSYRPTCNRFTDVLARGIQPNLTPLLSKYSMCIRSTRIHVYLTSKIVMSKNHNVFWSLLDESPVFRSPQKMRNLWTRLEIHSFNSVLAHSVDKTCQLLEKAFFFP